MCVVAMFALPGIARAESATIGSTLTASHNVSILAASATQLATAAPEQLVIPANGLLTSWAVRSSDFGADYELNELHPVSGPGLQQGFTVTAFIASNAPVPDFSDSVRTYPGNNNGGTNLDLKKGDYLGITGNGALPAHQSGAAGDVYATYPTFGNPNTVFGPPTGITGRELLLQATERYCLVPDLRHLKLGVARQEVASHDCQIVVAYTKKVRSKRKRNRVLKQDVPPGTTNVPNSPVSVIVGKLTRKKR